MVRFFLLACLMTVGVTASEHRLVVLGDSLAAGFGVEQSESWPTLLDRRWRQRGTGWRVVNAGVSGDTTAGGVARIDWLLRARPAAVLIELGANDGLRGFDLAVTETNLRTIVGRCRAAGARVFLAGIRLPPNYGADYATAFAGLFPRLAADLEVPLLPFLLAGVAGNPALNLADRLHPNPAGHRVVADTVDDFLARHLFASGASATAATGR